MFYALNAKGVQSKSANQRVTLHDILEVCQGKRRGVDMPGAYMELPKLAAAIVVSGCRKSKDRYDEIKRRLPYIIPAGYRPTSTGNGDGALELNGRVALDYDDKTPHGADVARAVLLRVKDNPPAGLEFASLSPGTRGNKFIFNVALADGAVLSDENYKAVGKQLAADFAAEVGLDVRYFDILPSGQSMYVPFDRADKKRYPGAAAWFGVEPRVVEVKPDVAMYAPELDIEYTSGETADAARWLIEQKTDVAGCYADYVKICFACARGIGGEDGRAYAWRLLSNSYTFERSTFKTQFAQRWREIVSNKTRETGRKVTGAVLVRLAKKAGFVPTQTAGGVVHKLKADEYLEDALARLKLAPDDILGRDIVAGTGTGKTTLIAKLANTERRVVVLLPEMSAVQNAARKTGGRAFYGDNQTTRFLDEHDVLAFCTIASFSAFCSLTDVAGWHVVFDEAHIFATDGAPGYRGKELHTAWRLAARAKTVTTMTGTALPNCHPDFAERERLTFETPPRKKKSKIYRVANTAAEVARICRVSVAAGRVPWVLLNDKATKRVALRARLRGLQVCFLDSDQKKTPEYQTVVGGALPEGYDVYISTTVIRAGNDIHEPRPVDIVAVGVFHSATLEQVAARFRNQKDAVLHVVKKQKNTDEVATFDRHNATRAFVKLGYQQKSFLMDAAFAGLQITNMRTNAAEMYVYEFEDAVEVDHFHINARVTDMEALFEYQTDAVQIRALSVYGYVTELVEVAEVADDPAEVADAVAAVKADKEQQKQRYEADADEVLTSSMPDIALRGVRGKFATRAKECVKRYGVTAYEAARLLRDAFTKSDYHRTRVRMDKAQLYRNAAYMNANPDALKIDTEITRTFSAGERLTSNEILARMRRVVELHKIKDTYLTGATEDVQKRKALDMLRAFFDVQKIQTKSEKHPHKREFYLKEIYVYGGANTDQPTPPKPAKKRRPVPAGGEE